MAWEGGRVGGRGENLKHGMGHGVKMQNMVWDMEEKIHGLGDRIGNKQKHDHSLYVEV